MATKILGSPKKKWWSTSASTGKVVVPIVVAAIGLIGAVVAAWIQASARSVNSAESNPSAKVSAPVATGPVQPQLSQPPRTTELHSLNLYNQWLNRHPEIVREYGAPHVAKFVNVHEQPFKRGKVLYITDGYSVWLFPKGDSGGDYRELTNGKDLTPGTGLPKVDEDVFTEVTKHMTKDERHLYRSLVDSRVISADAKGIGIIGGIASLYIGNKFYDALGEPIENEQLFHDMVYTVADGYKVLIGLRHSVGPTSSTAPKSVYILYPDGTYSRQVVFPRASQE